MILFYIVVVGALVGTFIALMRDTVARSVLFVAWISIIVLLCIFSTDIYGYYDLILQKIKEVIENFDKYRSAAIFYCTLAALVGTIIGFILGSGRNWPWSRRLWGHIKKNPPIILLGIAWIFIGLAIWFFGFDILKLYRILAEQILKGEEDADGYRAIAIRYFGIVAGAGAVIGYIFATGRNIISDNQNKINTRAQTTESMVQAITQIGAVNDGKPNVEVRLGGLYSLQRIMKDSIKDEETIAKIFYAYVRENIARDRIKQAKKIEKLKKSKGAEQEHLQLPEDIQAVLIIISQLNEEWREQGIEWYFDLQLNFSYTNFSCYFLQSLDVRNTRLDYANFSYTNLEFAQLSGASLHKVNFSGAMLFYTDLSNAHLAFANLTDATVYDVDLSNANLRFADLSGADLREVCFTNIDLREANLSCALLHGVDLSTAIDLTQEQINEANGDQHTKLPEGLTSPEHWIDLSQELNYDYLDDE